MSNFVQVGGVIKTIMIYVTMGIKYSTGHFKDHLSLICHLLFFPSSFCCFPVTFFGCAARYESPVTTSISADIPG